MVEKIWKGGRGSDVSGFKTDLSVGHAKAGAEQNVGSKPLGRPVISGAL